jgi:REP element-mobilizing transposase RayT
LQGYDYSQAGVYFVTICTQNRQCLFGDILDGEMRLNDAGWVVADEWIKTPVIRDEIELDKWVVMPNHFHGILLITGSIDRHCTGDRRVAPTGPQPRSVGAVMAGYKSAVTKCINELHQTPGAKLWQRNYWEHIVRNEPELNRLREYIQNNPKQWEMDSLYPAATMKSGQAVVR